MLTALTVEDTPVNKQGGINVEELAKLRGNTYANSSLPVQVLRRNPLRADDRPEVFLR